MQNTPSDGKHSRLHIASIFWGVLCLFLILSCAGRHSYPADLAMADTLCRTNPDSAVAYVKSISKKYASSSNPYDRNYYQLLTVKAANNVYKPIKDSTIFRVMDFYEKANDTEKLCQTYYYVGKHFVQENDAPQALQYFQKALDLTDENTPLSFLSCIYSQTGSLFLYQEMYDDALTMYKKSYSCDSLLRDTVNMLYSMQDIATIYNFKKDYCKCLDFLNTAHRLSKGLGNNILRNSISQSLAICYFDIKDYSKAKSYMMETLKNLEDGVKSSAYSLAIDIYSKETKLDSVFYFSKKLMECGTVYSKQKAASALCEFYNCKNDSKTALLYLKESVTLQDSINRINAVSTIGKMHFAYNYNKQEKENIKMAAEAKENRYVCFISILLFLFIFTLYIYKRGIAKKQYLQISLSNERLKNLVVETERNYEMEKTQTTEKHLMEIKALNDKSLVERNEYENEIKRIKEILDELIESNNEKKYETEKAANEICDFIKQKMKMKINLKNIDWSVIEKSFNTIYPNFKSAIYAKSYLKEDDYRICMLIKLNFSNSDISELMNRTAAAISMKRGKLLGKLFSTEGEAKDFNARIKDL